MNDTNEITRVLLVDDDEDDYVVIRELLAEAGTADGSRRYELSWCPDISKARGELEKAGHDVFLFDYRLGEITGLDLLKITRDLEIRAPVILLTGYGDQDVDMEAMRTGAADYLVKDQLTAHLLERSIRYAVTRAHTIETLREREESFRSLLDAAFEGIIVHELDGTIIQINASGAEIFGYERHELLGRNLFEICHDDPKSASPSEGTATRKDGARIHLEVNAKPFQYLGRKARLTAIRDITARKQMETQILLQDRLASVGLLASSLAHEIGTPLGVIRGRAEYLSMQGGTNAAVKKNVDVIISQIDRVSKLIRSLLNLARGDKNVGASTVSVSEVVADVLELMGHELRKHRIEIRNEFADRSDVMVNASPESLHQVLLNLLVNSVHAIESATRDGRGDRHFIRIGADSGDEEWMIAVEDTGCGISRENMRNLFKPFFTTKDIGVGTGLGLVTSYRLVESWGGTISVDSEEGVGTTFRITLPRS